MARTISSIKSLFRIIAKSKPLRNYERKAPIKQKQRYMYKDNRSNLNTLNVGSCVYGYEISVSVKGWEFPVFPEALRHNAGHGLRDIFSTELEIRLSFVKTPEYRGGGLNTPSPPR
jgi:hypothetical protein